MRRLRTLQLIALALLVVGAIAAFVYWTGEQERTHLEAEYRHRLLSNAQERVHIIERYIQNLETQVRFLAVVPPTQGIARAAANQGVDALENSTQAQWEDRLQRIFAGLINAHPELTQLRLISVAGNGKEIVRVDRVKNQAFIVPPAQLQEKGMRDYVQETLKRALGSVYVSHINLNREHGKVDVPHVPTLRVATPVEAVGGGNFGLLVINSNVNHQLESLQQFLPEGAELYLVNDQGDFIVHPQAEKTFGFDLGRRYRWQDEFQALPGQPGRYQYRQKAWHVVTQPVTLDHAREAKPYQLALALPDAIIARQVANHRFEMLLVGSAGLVLPVLLALQFVRNLRLRQFSQSMAGIVDAAPYALVLVDEKGYIENVNAMTETLFGYPRSQLIGQPIEILVPTHFREKHIALRNRFLQAPTQYFLAQRPTLLGQHANGDTFPIEIGLNHLKTDTGVKVLAGVLDVRQRKDTEAERDRLIGILERTSDFIGMADMHGNLKFHNRAALAMVGLPPDTDLASLHISDMHPAWAAERVLTEGIPAAIRDGIWRGDNALLHRDGHEIPVTQVLLLHRNEAGEPEYLSTVMRDVSEQKQRERELEQARQDAEAASRAKSSFVANMSHEIRTPLNAVIGMLQLLKRTVSTSQQHDYVEKAEIGAQSLLALLNDILDFSKMEAGKITLESQTFRLDDVMKRLGVVLYGSVGQKNIEVLFDIEPGLPKALVGDALRLQQILLNLAGNAIKFTEEGEVVVSVRSVSRTAADDENPRILLRFEISDTGIGIAPEHWEKIFEGFSQADASISRRFGGTGLGLAISRHLVQLMGGMLDGHSAPGKGTVFYFELPFFIDVDNDELARPTILQGLRVLVVEDNVKTCAVLTRMLTLFGWLPQIAHGKDDALQAYEQALQRQLPFDVVLIDWSLPRMEGFKTGRRLRSIPSQLKVPVMLMMTHHDGEYSSLMDTKEIAEVDGVVSKPITASALLDAVMDAYRQRGLLGPQRSVRPMPTLTLAGVRILLVEDNPINQQVARDLLRLEGATVTVADNGKIAVDLLTKNPLAYDVVLMDVQMPVMNGYDATEIIRRRLGLTQLPIIAMTANAMREDCEAAMAKGMNDHVGKPFDIRALSNLIRQYVGPRRSARLATTPASPVAPLPRADKPPADGTAEAPTLDIVRAMARFGNDPDIYRQALSRWYDEWKRFQGQIHQAVTDQDRELLVRTLHSIKGVAATLGATAFSRRAGALEDVVKSGVEASEWQGLLQPLPAAADALQHEIDRQLAAAIDGGPSDNAKPAVPVTQDELRLLSQRLQAGSMDALTQIQAWAEGDDLTHELRALKDAVLNLDFRQAQTLCDNMLRALNT